MVECRYAECGERVLLSDIEQHLKHHCLSRSVKCQDCGKELLFKELQVSMSLSHPFKITNIVNRVWKGSWWWLSLCFEEMWDVPRWISSYQGTVSFPIYCNFIKFILHQLNDHIMNECTWIKCPCSSEKDVLFEVSIHSYQLHEYVLMISN